MAGKKIEQAIQITELKQDLGNLIKQAQTINGAIQYIQQKIAQLSKQKDSKEEK